MKAIIKDSFILFAITIISGLLLGWVYDITKEPIEKQKQIAKEKACSVVFEDAAGFDAVDLNQFSGKTAFAGGDVEEVLAARDGAGTQLGYVITVTSHEGYGGDITFMVGIRNDGTVNAISFTSISETAGLGMKAKNDEFKTQFNGKNVSAFVYTKQGAAAENEIDAISAATITTSAVTGGVNGALAFFHDNLATGGVVNE